MRKGHRQPSFTKCVAMYIWIHLASPESGRSFPTVCRSSMGKLLTTGPTLTFPTSIKRPVHQCRSRSILHLRLRKTAPCLCEEPQPKQNRCYPVSSPTSFGESILKTMKIMKEKDMNLCKRERSLLFKSVLSKRNKILHSQNIT